MYSYVDFTDETAWTGANPVVPFVRTTTRQRHARRLCPAIRLSCFKVGVRQWVHCFIACLCQLHSPDERRATSCIYALTSYPKEPSPWRIIGEASSQCWSWNIHVFGSCYLHCFSNVIVYIQILTGVEGNIEKNNAPKLYNVGRGSKARQQHWTTSGTTFHCWSRLKHSPRWQHHARSFSFWATLWGLLGAT